jgi:hypothetical protein
MDGPTMKNSPRSPSASATAWLRAACLAVLTALASSQASAAMLAPFYNFVDVPVAKPTTPQRVKAAIVNAALLQVWTIVENPDGSLTASMWKIREYDFKVRITYDANRYSIVYLDSQGLERVVGYTGNTGLFGTASRYTLEEVEARSLATVKALPEGPSAVKADFHMHPGPGNWLRELLGGIRRELAAPAF